MATHRFAIGMGHRNEKRGGASKEIDWTPGAARALRDAIEARGGQAWLIQEHDGDDDDSFSRGKDPMDAANAGISRIVDDHGTLDAIIFMHYNGGGSRGAHFIHPDGWTAPERKRDNPGDVRLAKAMKKHLAKTNTVGFLSWPGWIDDEPGVMSERESGAVGNREPKRLGEMLGARKWQATTTRIVAEAGSIDVLREKAFINDPHWVRHIYCEALVDALEEEYGAMPNTARGEIPRRGSGRGATGFEPFRPSAVLQAFQHVPESVVPIAVQDGDVWWMKVFQEVTILEQTPRLQFASGASVGPDLMPGETAYIAFSTIAEGRPIGYTYWSAGDGTRIRLEDTDFGVTD